MQNLNQRIQQKKDPLVELNKILRNSIPNSVKHYTSLNSLEKMLSNKECIQQKCLDCHLYSLDDTNDQEEFLMIKKLFSNKSNKSKDFEKCFNNFRTLNGYPVFASFTRSRRTEINEVGMWNTYC